MGCCDPANAIIGGLLSGGAIASYAAIRRDTLANQGNASDYAFDTYVQLFIEDRTASNLGDVFWIPAHNGTDWTWTQIMTVPTAGGGSPWE
jgi:hypothetical protein